MMTQTDAFQEDAFQYDAFQIDTMTSTMTSAYVPRTQYTEPEDLIEYTIKQVMRKGKTLKEATSIVRNKFIRSGLLDPKTGELTQKGQVRQQMTSAQRAFSRSKLQAKDGYFWNPQTNKIERRP